MPNLQPPGTYNAAPNLGHSNPYIQSSNSQYSTRDTSSDLKREVNELKAMIRDLKREESRKREEDIAKEDKARAKRERENSERRERAIQFKRETKKREVATQQELAELRRGLEQSLRLMQHKMMEAQNNSLASGRTRVSLVDHMPSNYTARDWRLSDGHGGTSSLQDEFIEYMINKRRQEERRSTGGGEVDDNFTGSLQRGLQVTSRPAMEIMDPDSLRRLVGSILMELLPTLNKGPSLERDKDSTNDYVIKSIMKGPTDYPMEASKLREMYNYGKAAAKPPDQDDMYLSLEHSDLESRTPEFEELPMEPRDSPQHHTPKARAKPPLRVPPESVAPKSTKIPTLDSGYSSLVGRSSTRNAHDPHGQILNKKVSRPKGAENEKPPKSSARAPSNIRSSKYRKPSVHDVDPGESDNTPKIPERKPQPYGILKKRTPVEAPTPPSYSSDSEE